MRFNYQESRCEATINKLYECCEQMYRRDGEDARASACPKPDVLKLKLERARKQ